MPTRSCLPLLGLTLAVLATDTAVAHAGGVGGVETRFVMPAWVVWAAGAGVVAITFALVGAFLTERTVRAGEAPAGPPAADLRLVPLARVLQALGLAGLALVVAAPWLPDSAASADALVWVGVWALTPMVAYALVNPWPSLSPFRLIAPVVSRVRPRPAAYPAWLAHWPAVAGVLALTAFEVWPGLAHTPTGLAALTAAYVLATLAGMLAFGADAWLTNADPLERLFAWLGAFSPVARTAGRWRLGWPGARLVHRAADGPSDVAFVVALLYGVNFDGFVANGPSGTLLAGAARLVGAGAAFAAMLVAGFAFFLAAYATCAWTIARIAPTPKPLRVIAARFAPALVPIAVGYHLAHNLFYVLAAVGATPSGALTAGAAVSVQMLFIVAGHVVAVLVAHEQAFARFPSRVQAIRSELALTGVMVIYTLVGLWIVSQGHAATGLAGVGA